MSSSLELDKRRIASLATLSEITERAVRDISGGLNALLAHIFALYLKTKNFHGHIARLPRLKDYGAEYVTPQDTLSELREDEETVILRLLAVHTMCDDASDVATASFIENWIDQAQKRRWFLFEATRSQGAN